MPIRVGFLASGNGTSVESLVKKIQEGTLPDFNAAVVLCNKPPGNAGIYERSERLHLPVHHACTTLDQLRIFREHDVDMVLGLGYIRLVGQELLDAYGRNIWNIHPALLPRHGGPGMYGLAVHRAVIESGDTETGATVHIMNSRYDDGDILNQVRIPVFRGETPEQLQQRVLPFEYALMASTLHLYAHNLLSNCKRELS